jgi:FMN phosphatase YigB (HAD superfamily)
MVGDREDMDISPAREAGIRTVRMLSGRHAHVSSSADFTISDISELIPILRKL